MNRIQPWYIKPLLPFHRLHFCSTNIFKINRILPATITTNSSINSTMVDHIKSKNKAEPSTTLNAVLPSLR